MQFKLKTATPSTVPDASLDLSMEASPISTPTASLDPDFIVKPCGCEDCDGDIIDLSHIDLINGLVFDKTTGVGKLGGKLVENTTVDTNGFSLQLGNLLINANGDIKLSAYLSTRDDGTLTKVLGTDADGNVKLGVFSSFTAADAVAALAQPAGQVLVGTGTGVSSYAGLKWNNRLDISTTAATGTREILFKGTVSDAGNDTFFWSNATSVDGRFVPALSGFVNSNSASGVLQFNALIMPANDIGTVPLMNFITYTTPSATDPLNQVFGSVSTRPLFAWWNQGTAMMQMEASGALSVKNIIRAFDATLDNTQGTALDLRAGRGKGSASSGNVNIWTAPAGAAGSTLNTERVVATFTPDGKMGIGTTPTYALDILGDATAAFRVKPNGTASASDFFVIEQNNGVVPFKVNGSGVVNMTAAARVSISSIHNTGVERGEIAINSVAGGSTQGLVKVSGNVGNNVFVVKNTGTGTYTLEVRNSSDVNLFHVKTTGETHVLGRIGHGITTPNAHFHTHKTDTTNPSIAEFSSTSAGTQFWVNDEKGIYKVHDVSGLTILETTDLAVFKVWSYPYLLMDTESDRINIYRDLTMQSSTGYIRGMDGIVGLANQVGQNLNYSAGRSTGSAAGGSHNFYVTGVGVAGGTTLNTEALAMSIAASKDLTIYGNTTMKGIKIWSKDADVAQPSLPFLQLDVDQSGVTNKIQIVDNYFYGNPVGGNGNKKGTLLGLFSFGRAEKLTQHPLTNFRWAPEYRDNTVGTINREWAVNQSSKDMQFVAGTYNISASLAMTIQKPNAINHATNWYKTLDGNVIINNGTTTKTGNISDLVETKFVTTSSLTVNGINSNYVSTFFLNGLNTVQTFRHYVATTPELNNPSSVVTNVTGLYIEPQKAAQVVDAYGIYQEGTNDKNYFGGLLYANTLKTTTTAPATTGQCQVVVTDTNGLQSRTDLKVADDDAAAATAGVAIGEVYITSTNVLRGRIS